MNSVQESKQELEAAIRYAENAISSANKTIESMEFRQEMAKKQSSEQTGREAALEEERAMLEKNVKYLRDENERLKAEVNALEQPEKPTMPVIPKAVAIAIFREGVQHGVEAACTELEGQTINIEEREYVGGFEVSFDKLIDLDDELDLDWMRGKCGDYSEDAVVNALKNLCADNKFECRVHGVDDQES
jgi:predicted RNase H-like nuclease (RuvC/YqgF family)